MSTPPAATISADALLELAAAETGLEDYGERFFEEGLRAFIDAINSEARLNDMGRMAQSMDFVRTLSNRLRFQRDLTEHPEILAEQLISPIVIVGLPRSGTTKLQRTLSAAPDVQRLETWRLMNPAPLPTPLGVPDPRIAIAETVEQTLAQLAPKVMAAHPTEAREPEEEAMLFMSTYETIALSMQYRVPSYQEWLRGRDQRRQYAYVHSLLQYLQWQDGGGRGRPWIMKSPIHLGNLSALFDTFPDATVVFCHRDPREALPSFASLIESHRRQGSDAVEPSEVGVFLLELWGEQVDHALDARSTLGDERFIDVSYRAICDDIDQVIAEIYTRSGRDLTGEAVAAFDSYSARRPQHHFGRHEYTAARHGLDDACIEERFAAYYDRFPDTRG